MTPQQGRHGIKSHPWGVLHILPPPYPPTRSSSSLRIWICCLGISVTSCRRGQILLYCGLGRQYKEEVGEIIIILRSQRCLLFFTKRSVLFPVKLALLATETRIQPCLRSSPADRADDAEPPDPGRAAGEAGRTERLSVGLHGEVSNPAPV